jgi:hypothetical protein
MVSRPDKHHQATVEHVDFGDGSKSWVATVKVTEKPKPKKRPLWKRAVHIASNALDTVGRYTVKGLKFAYTASGLADVANCATGPTLSGCAKAAALVAAFAVTGGEDELEIAGYRAADEATSEAEDAASCATSAVHSFTAATKVLEADGTTVAMRSPGGVARPRWRHRSPMPRPGGLGDQCPNQTVRTPACRRSRTTTCRR